MATFPLDFGPLSPIADLAGVLVQEQKAEMNQWLDEDVQTEIEETQRYFWERDRSSKVGKSQHN